MEHPDILAPDAHPPQVDDLSVPNVARMYDYLLGGSTNTLADREKAKQVLRQTPEAAECARTNRTFATNAIQVVIHELGIRQFIDLGAGVPTAGGLHAVAQHCDPTIRWAAVDNELVAVSNGTLVTEHDPNIRYVFGDLTKPHLVLHHELVRDIINFRQPVCYLLCAALHLVDASKEPEGVVATYRDASVPGSALILSHGTCDDPNVPTMNQLPAQYRETNNQYTPRSRAEVEKFAAGYDLLAPGIVLTGDWRYERLRSADTRPKSGAYGFVGVRR